MNSANNLTELGSGTWPREASKQECSLGQNLDRDFQETQLGHVPRESLRDNKCVSSKLLCVWLFGVQHIKLMQADALRV